MVLEVRWALATPITGLIAFVRGRPPEKEGLRGVGRTAAFVERERLGRESRGKGAAVGVRDWAGLDMAEICDSSIETL